MITEMKTSKGWRVAVGQVWRSNDTRNIRAVRVEDIMTTGYVGVRNVVTGKTTWIHVDNFRPGARGWSLDKDVTRAA